MQVPEGVQQKIESGGMRTIALPTDEACETYNRLRMSEKAGAALHLTC
jgi:hypothetical protein